MNEETIYLIEQISLNADICILPIFFKTYDEAENYINSDLPDREWQPEDEGGYNPDIINFDYEIRECVLYERN